jgi:hypothetical protein
MWYCHRLFVGLIASTQNGTVQRTNMAIGSRLKSMSVSRLVDGSAEVPNVDSTKCKKLTREYEVLVGASQVRQGMHVVHSMMTKPAGIEQPEFGDWSGPLLMIYPTVLGRSKSSFPPNVRIGLALGECRQIGSGIVYISSTSSECSLTAGSKLTFVTPVLTQLLSFLLKWQEYFGKAVNIGKRHLSDLQRWN